MSDQCRRVTTRLLKVSAGDAGEVLESSRRPPRRVGSPQSGNHFRLSREPSQRNRR